MEPGFFKTEHMRTPISVQDKPALEEALVHLRHVYAVMLGANRRERIQAEIAHVRSLIESCP